METPLATPPQMREFTKSLMHLCSYGHGQKPAIQICRYVGMETERMHMYTHTLYKCISDIKTRCVASVCMYAQYVRTYVRTYSTYTPTCAVSQALSMPLGVSCGCYG